MFIFNYDTFEKGWEDFVEENPGLIEDVSDYLDDLLYDLEKKDIAEFFAENFEYVKGEGGNSSLMALPADNFGFSSKATLEKVKNELVSMGEDKNQVEKVFPEDEIIENDDLYIIAQSFGESTIKDIEDEIGIDVYWYNDYFGEYLGIKVSDFVDKIWSGGRKIDEEVVEDLVLFREKFYSLGEDLYEELKKIYNERKEEFDSVVEFLNKINEEDDSFFFNFIADYLEVNYSDAPSLLSTFVKDIEEKKEKVKEIEDVFNKYFERMGVEWEEILKEFYFDRKKENYKEKYSDYDEEGYEEGEEGFESIRFFNSNR